MSEGIVITIEKQNDRVLLFLNPTYYVIASSAQAQNIRCGDSISYEPYGYNFGWLV